MINYFENKCNKTVKRLQTIALYGAMLTDNSIRLFAYDMIFYHLLLIGK